MTQTQVSGSGIKNNVITNNHLHSAANIASSKLANSGVTAGSYGSGSATLSLTINAKGVITAASTNAISIGTSNISNNSVTFEKIENIVANQIIGRITSGTGSPQALSAAHVRTIINVEDGATADQSASEILTLIKTVDGAGSGLDADTLDGISSGNFLRTDVTQTASNRITLSSGSLQLSGHYFHSVYSGTTHYIHLYPYGTSSGNASVTNIRAWNGSGGADTLQITGGTATGVKWRGYTVWTAENDGSGSTLDADTVDGLQANQFLRSDANDTINAELTTKVLNFTGVGSNSNNSAYSYAIYQAGGTWSHPFPDLIIGYHTGIKIGGYTSYGGTRFYNDAPERTGATEIFSVGNGDNHVRVANDLILNGGAGALSVSANSDIRLASGTWTGNTAGKIQHHNNILYFQGGSSGFAFLHSDGTGRWTLDGSGHFLPNQDSTYNIGSNSKKVANGYFDTLYGDGSNLTGVTSTTINNNANNRIITGSDTANTLEAESNLSFNGSTISISSGSSDEKLKLFGTNPYIRFLEGSTEKAYIQWVNSGILQFVNQESGEYLRIKSGSNGLTFTVDGSEKTVWHSGNDGSGSGLDSDTVDGIQGSSFLRSDAADTASGDITFSGGAGAVTIAAASDIRLSNGNWTGNTCKIQHHSNRLYIVGGSDGIRFREGGSDRALFDGSGHFLPAENNTYDMGSSSLRWRNIYTNDLNLSNEGGANDVDGTYGSYTIQEGHNDLFLINKRTGKKFKFNLTEVK